jgi:cytochrome c peroxidase
VVALAGLAECLSLPLANDDSPSPGASAAIRQRFATGIRPLRVVALPAAGCVAVVGMLDDSITFIEPAGRSAPRRVMLSPHAVATPQDRGERAFFDAGLSAGGFLSCHSCHSEAHTNGLLSDTLGDDTDGAPKRVPTLLGTGMTYRWGWNGAQQSLHDQVLKSIDQTMGGKPRFQDGTDMVAFFHTLAPPPPLEPAASDRLFVERGRAVFMERGCGNCHVPPLVYASHESYDVGLTDERGLRKFNPPSLRGVSQAGRWLHDGRAGSLEAVFRDHAHPNDMRWTETELPALLRFLRSL